MSNNNELENISKIIGAYGDRSMSKIVVQDKELNKIMDDICNIIEVEAGEETVVEVEELINAYIGRGMNIAYLTGFRDCMTFKQEVNSLHKE